MNKEERDEMLDTIRIVLQGEHARSEAKFDIIDSKLDNINNHLCKLNGKVASHEKQLNDDLLREATRPQTCPFKNDIEETKKEIEFKRKLNKWLIGSLVVLNLSLGIVIAVISIV